MASTGLSSDSSPAQSPLRVILLWPRRRAAHLHRRRSPAKTHREYKATCSCRSRMGRTLKRRPIRAIGIRDRPIAPASPWQNGIAERLIGTLRRECLDQMVIFSEAHLRRILSAYVAYYNQTRPHLALHKDAPLRRVVQRLGSIVAVPVLAGLHHQYVRI
jgi:hypothetical protein